jgi:hypothetical protein
VLPVKKIVCKISHRTLLHCPIPSRPSSCPRLSLRLPTRQNTRLRRQSLRHKVQAPYQKRMLSRPIRSPGRRRLSRWASSATLRNNSVTPRSVGLLRRASALLRASAAGFTVIPMLGASDQVSVQNLMRHLPQRMCMPVHVLCPRLQQRPPHPCPQKCLRLHPQQRPPCLRTLKRKRLRPRSLLFPLSLRLCFRLMQSLLLQRARAWTRLINCGCGM